jgi:hypothetical protein
MKIRWKGSGFWATPVVSVSESSSGAQRDAEGGGRMGRASVVLMTSLRSSSSKHCSKPGVGL